MLLWALAIVGLMQLTYTRDQLFKLFTPDVTVSRAARKAIFSHELWSPPYVRGSLQRRLLRWRDNQPVFTCVRRSADCCIAKPKPTSSERHCSSSLLKFGLLNAQSVGNKHTAISDAISAGEYDVFLLTETWHTAGTDVALTRCAPPGFSIVGEPRPTKKASATNHGGVAAVINDHLTHRLITPPFKPQSFESTCFSVTSSAATVVILLLYRPGSSDVTSEFFADLTKYLECLALYKCQIVIAGDFNVHAEATDDSATKQLHDILDSFYCTQHVPLTETHTKGGTLDLLITKSDQLVADVRVDPLVSCPTTVLSAGACQFNTNPQLCSSARSEAGHELTVTNSEPRYCLPSCATLHGAQLLQKTILRRIIMFCSRSPTALRLYGRSSNGASYLRRGWTTNVADNDVSRAGLSDVTEELSRPQTDRLG